jgi:hypothetical protein
MRNAVIAVVVVGALSMVGCKRQVPTDIVQKSLRNAMSSHAPLTTSGMCGANVRGIPNATITVTKRNPDNTGIAHVRGTPWGGAPSTCEGDVEFKYSYTSKTTGYKRKTTTTTWYLDHVKLVAVQTKGVNFKPVDENATDDDDGQ